MGDVMAMASLDSGRSPQNGGFPVGPSAPSRTEVVDPRLSSALEIARALIRKHGSEAALFAWAMADDYADNGDADQFQKWIEILDSIEGIVQRHLGGSGTSIASVDTAMLENKIRHADMTSS